MAFETVLVDVGTVRTSPRGKRAKINVKIPAMINAIKPT